MIESNQIKITQSSHQYIASFDSREIPIDGQLDAIENSPLRPHLRAKVDAKCRECIYDSRAEGTWRKQVENCTSFGCPLFDVRPTSYGRV